MTDPQWETLLKTIKGETQHPLPVGFIIDCPWLPNWHGVRILDYFSNDALWLEANLKALRTFPDALFLPGFWSEYGMCTEPSAFGARCNFPANEFPHAHKVIRSSADIDDLVVPDPRTDGLLPFVLNRLKLAQPHIEAMAFRSAMQHLLDAVVLRLWQSDRRHREHFVHTRERLQNLENP